MLLIGGFVVPPGSMLSGFATLCGLTVAIRVASIGMPLCPRLPW